MVYHKETLHLLFIFIYIVFPHYLNSINKLQKVRHKTKPKIQTKASNSDNGLSGAGETVLEERCDFTVVLLKETHHAE